MGQRAHRPAHYTAAGRTGAGGHGPDPSVVQMLSQASGNAVVAGMLRQTRRATPEALGLREDPLPPAPAPGPPTGTFQLTTTVAYDPDAPDPLPEPSPRGTMEDAAPGEETHGDEAELERLTLDPPMPSGATPETANPQAPATPEAPVRGEEGPAAEPDRPEAARQEEPPEESEDRPEARDAAAPVSLPDIVIPGLAELEATDSVSSWLGYTGAISRGGAGPSGYGVTRFGDVKLTGITVTPLPWLGVFVVRATVEHTITWQVRSRTGPSGEVDVASFLSPAITAANHGDVADDLTPDMSDLGGRPPRNAFWAEDLTERHERFHADDVKGHAPTAVGVASSWLSAQTAADVPGVHALLASVPGRVVTALIAYMAVPAGEERAYGDGAGAYTRRAMAIRAAGAAGLYP